MIRGLSATLKNVSSILPGYPTSRLAARDTIVHAATVDSVAKLYVKQSVVPKCSKQYTFMLEVVSTRFFLGNIQLLGLKSFLEADSSLAVTKFSPFYRT
jgi:hypothetical protein